MPTAEMEAIKKELNDIKPVRPGPHRPGHEGGRPAQGGVGAPEGGGAPDTPARPGAPQGRRHAPRRGARVHSRSRGPLRRNGRARPGPAAPVRTLPAPRVVRPGVGRARRGREAHPGRRADARRHTGLSPRLSPKAGGVVLGRPQADRTVRGLRPVGPAGAHESRHGQHHRRVRRRAGSHPRGPRALDGREPAYDGRPARPHLPDALQSVRYSQAARRGQLLPGHREHRRRLDRPRHRQGDPDGS